MQEKKKKGSKQKKAEAQGSDGHKVESVESKSAKNNATTNVKNIVNKGDHVILHYTGSFEDGTVFDSSDKHKELLKFEAGNGQVIKGFDDAVLGMKKEEEKSFTIKPEEGYGQPDPKMVRQISRQNLPKDPEPKVGMMIVLGFDNGLEFPAKITAVNGDIVTIDLNHPLAGKTLNFKIKVIDIR